MPLRSGQEHVSVLASIESIEQPAEHGLVIGGSFDRLFMLDLANGTITVGRQVAVCISPRVDLK